MKRRDLLKQAGGVLAASMVSPAAVNAAQEAAASATAGASAPPISQLMTTVSTYMSEAGARALPEPVIEKTKHMILDTLAAAISGAQLPPGKFAIQFARAYGGEKISTVAASTVGEKNGIDGVRFMRAVALGYDIGPRVTATLGKIQYMAESHRSTHAISGTFVSAAAAGCAASLNARQMRWLLSYTAQLASGIASWQRDTEHVEKAFDFGGMPAKNGVTAALLVEAGGSGVDDILSGVDNFFQAFVPKNDPAMLVDKLGERYEITRTNVKKWTVGAPIQAPLDALENLLKKHGFEPDVVKQVVVRVATNEAKIVNNREIPDICLQHLCAVMLVDKTVTFKSAHDTPRMKDPAILRQRAKVQLVPDEALERFLPRRAAIVEVTLMDGRTVTERVDDVRGTSENPMGRDEIIAKARDLITPVLGAAGFQKLSDRIFDLEHLKNVRELRPLLQRG